MGKFADELIESLQQAARHAAAKKVRGLRVPSRGRDGASNGDEN